MYPNLALIKIFRLYNSILPVIALIAGYMSVKALNDKYLFLSVIALILAHSIVTIWNDIADEKSDKLNNIHRIGDIKKSGNYNKLLLLISILIIIGLLILVFLPLKTSLLFILFLIIGWLYNVPPLHGSHKPVISIVLLGLSYGLLPFMIGASLGDINIKIIVLATGWAIGRGSLSLLKDYKDATGDALAHKKTFLLVYGGKLTARLSFGLAVVGYISCIVITSLLITRKLSAILLLSFTALWLLYMRRELFSANQYDKLNQIFHKCIKNQIIFDGLVVLCLRTL